MDVDGRIESGRVAGNSSESCERDGRLGVAQSSVGNASCGRTHVSVPKNLEIRDTTSDGVVEINGGGPARRGRRYLVLLGTS